MLHFNINSYDNGIIYMCKPQEPKHVKQTLTLITFLMHKIKFVLDIYIYDTYVYEINMSILKLSFRFHHTYSIVPVHAWFHHLRLINTSHFHIPDTEVEAGAPGLDWH